MQAEQANLNVWLKHECLLKVNIIDRKRSGCCLIITYKLTFESVVQNTLPQIIENFSLRSVLVIICYEVAILVLMEAIMGPTIRQMALIFVTINS